jgi:O-antigen ligase
VSGPVLQWARLAETLSLIWLLPYLLSNGKDTQTLLRVLTLALAAQLVIALAMVAEQGTLPHRLSGPLDDPNSLGLVAALLLILAVHAPLSWPPWARVPLIVLALACLPLTRSIASMAAAAITLGIFGLRARPSSRWQQETLLAPLRLLVLFAGIVGVITLVRGDNVPWSENYNQSSTPERIILADAAVHIYLDHPVAGVGFTRSGTPEVVSDPELNATLRRQFPDVSQDFFPDVNPSHVHNTYLQVLADTGTVGGICLVLVLVGTWRGVRGGVRQRGPELDRRLARAVAAGLMVLLIWCNDNALFGGQVETASIGLLVGCIAASPRRSRPNPPTLQDAASAPSDRTTHELVGVSPHGDA